MLQRNKAFNNSFNLIGAQDAPPKLTQTLYFLQEKAMFRPIPIVIALLVHSIFALVIVPAVAIPRWSGFTMLGITFTFLAFSVHALGIYGIVKRLKWGYSFSKSVFGFYMITSGLGLLGSLARRSDLITTAERVIFFIVFIWLFMRFRSDPSVHAYFERSSSMTAQDTTHS